jgi:hypothetical protein
MESGMVSLEDQQGKSDEQIRDEALKRMLNTPPKPRKAKARQPGKKEAK